MVKRKDVRKVVHAALVDGMRRFGERIFSRSQETDKCYVPVDTGFLKRSGYTKQIPNGIEIGYIAPYSADVEVGHTDRPVQGTFSYLVPAHTRRSHTRVNPNGTVVIVAESTIPEHMVTLVNKRIITFRPKIDKFNRGPQITRVISVERGRKGQFFLARAAMDSLNGLPKDLIFALKKIKGAQVK